MNQAACWSTNTAAASSTAAASAPATPAPAAQLQECQQGNRSIRTVGPGDSEGLGEQRVAHEQESEARDGEGPAVGLEAHDGEDQQRDQGRGEQAMNRGSHGCAPNVRASIEIASG